MSEGVFSWTERLKQIPGQASALGKQGMDAIRSAAAQVGDALPKTAAQAGQMAGNAANTVEAGVDAAKTAASNVAEGFRSARGATPAAAPQTAVPGLDAAESGQTAQQRGFRNPNRTPGPVGATPQPIPGALDPAAAAAARNATGSPWGTSATGGTGGQPPVDPNSPAYKEGLKSAKGFRTGSGVGAGTAIAGELFDPNVRAAIDPTSDMSSTDRLKQLSRTALRTGGGILGGAAGGVFGGVVGGIPGAAVGYAAGDKVADWLVGDAKPAATTAKQQTPLSQQPVQAGMVQTNQGPQTPDQLIDGTAVPVSGQGAFRRESGARMIDPKTGKDLGPIGAQGKGPATKVGGGAMFGGLLPDLPKDATPEQADLYLQKSVALQNAEVRGREALRKDLAQINTRNPFDVGSGPAGAIAGLSAYGAVSRMQKNEADLGVRQDANNTAKAKVAADIAMKNREDLRKTQEVNRGTMDKELEDYARLKVGDPGLMTNSKDYEATVKNRLADIRKDINYSAGNRKDGRKLEDMEPAERQQLLLAKTLKDRVEGARGDIGQSLRDFVGNKRFDSKDLYSYIPKSVEPTLTPGGYKVVLGNGNTMTVTRAVDGSNKWLGPNGPVDADVMAIISPMVDKYEKTSKGK